LHSCIRDRRLGSTTQPLRAGSLRGVSQSGWQMLWSQGCPRRRYCHPNYLHRNNRTVLRTRLQQMPQRQGLLFAPID
jgi:hypothetical protein